MLSNFDTISMEVKPEDHHPDLVFADVLDERYVVEVVRISPTEGVLSIYDHDADDELVYASNVEVDEDLGDIFADYSILLGVHPWQRQAVEFIDGR